MSAPHQKLSTRQPSRLLDTLDQVRETAREQLEAAWRLHVDRVRDQLDQGWPDHLARVFEERFAELADRVGDEVERRVAEQLDEMLRATLSGREQEARRQIGAHLNQAARRIRDAEASGELETALLDAAAPFAGQVALFQVSGPVLRFRGGRGLRGPGLAGEEIPLSAAPAIQGAVQSGDCVVAMHGPGEFSSQIARALSAPPGSRVTLLPIMSAGQAAAVLWADSGCESVDLDSLELLANLAGAVLEGRTQLSGSAPPSLVSINAPPAPSPSTAPGWAELSREDQELHLRAQRVARVLVAEIVLYQSQEVREGRAAGDLYRRLKTEIDQGRAQFESDLLPRSESMIDYFHQELVRTLANDEESLLGPGYPGPLV